MDIMRPFYGLFCLIYFCQDWIRVFISSLEIGLPFNES